MAGTTGRIQVDQRLEHPFVVILLHRHGAQGQIHIRQVGVILQCRHLGANAAQRQGQCGLKGSIIGSAVQTGSPPTLGFSVTCPLGIT